MIFTDLCWSIIIIIIIIYYFIIIIILNSIAYLFLFIAVYLD